MPYKDIHKQREYQLAWILARRALWFEDKVCRNCGSKEGLELDHIDPSKKFTHRIWSYTWDKIMKEVAKCQVLCYDCHKIKTATDIVEMRTKAHGTEDGYEKYKCRCPECSQFASGSLGQRYVGMDIDTAKELVNA